LYAKVATLKSDNPLPQPLSNVAWGDRNPDSPKAPEALQGIIYPRSYASLAGTTGKSAKHLINQLFYPINDLQEVIVGASVI
jgi:hypothetical protein